MHVSETARRQNGSRRGPPKCFGFGPRHPLVYLRRLRDESGSFGGSMSRLLSTTAAYQLAGLFLTLLYAIQAEIRFGAKARASAAGAADRGSTTALSLAAAVPIMGFVMVIQLQTTGPGTAFGRWLRDTAMPGLPAVAWAGVALGILGLVLRMWAVLVLRERYTRTLLVHDQHLIERGGPYRFVRHPGYLG